MRNYLSFLLLTTPKRQKIFSPPEAVETSAIETPAGMDEMKEKGIPTRLITETTTTEPPNAESMTTESSTETHKRRKRKRGSEDKRRPETMVREERDGEFVSKVYEAMSGEWTTIKKVEVNPKEVIEGQDVDFLSWAAICGKFHSRMVLTCA